MTLRGRLPTFPLVYFLLLHPRHTSGVALATRTVMLLTAIIDSFTKEKHQVVFCQPTTLNVLPPGSRQDFQIKSQRTLRALRQ